MQGLCSQRATSQTPDNVLPQARAGLSPARSPLYCSTVYYSTLSRSAAHGIPPISPLLHFLLSTALLSREACPQPDLPPTAPPSTALLSREAPNPKLPFLKSQISNPSPNLPPSPLIYSLLSTALLSLAAPPAGFPRFPYCSTVYCSTLSRSAPPPA
jgi:hypothetical protein